jgi:hypothetical protein
MKHGREFFMVPNDIKSSGTPELKDKGKAVDVMRLNLAEHGISNDGADYPHRIMMKLFGRALTGCISQAGGLAAR